MNAEYPKYVLLKKSIKNNAACRAPRVTNKDPKGIPKAAQLVTRS